MREFGELHRYEVLFDLYNGREWETHTRPVTLETGYSTVDDIPKMIAIWYGVAQGDVNVISVKEWGK